MQEQSVNQGRLIVLTAPSGAGKTTLVRALLERLPELDFSISFTTRPRRESEQEGRDYFFVSEAKFAQMIANGELVEHARVFGHCYGTGRAYLSRQLAAGRTVLLEIDWQGARQIRQHVPGAVSIFILPPSIGELERRLRTRATDAPSVIDQRLGEAFDDMRHWDEFDYVLVNDDRQRAADALAMLVSAARTGALATRAEAARIVDGEVRAAHGKMDLPTDVGDGAS